MQYIDFNVQHQTITRTDKYEVVGKSQNYLYARFQFCAEWAGVLPTAVFSLNNGKHYSALIEEGVCLVPWEVLEGAEFWVGVFGGERMTTSTVRVPVKPSVKLNASPGLQPTPTAYEKMVSYAEGIAESVETAQAAAESAAETADRAEQMIESMVVDKENLDRAVTQAAGSATAAAGSAASAQAQADRAQAEAERASVPAVAGVYNVVLTDRVTAERYALIVENGRLSLLGVSETLASAEVNLIDNATGTAYNVVVESGRLVLEEV